MRNDAKLQEISGRLKKGEGWIGYRHSTNNVGEKVRSKFLYFAFYQGKTQKFVNSKTNDLEDAYRQLLETRGQVERGDRLLPSEVSRICYEDLKQILVDYYREKAPDPLYRRRTKDAGSEETFLGADKLVKTEHIFERYNIKTTDDLKEALIKVGQFKHGTVSSIAEKPATR